MVGPYSAGEVYDIDNTPPAGPSISGASTDTGTAGDGVTIDTTLVISGSADPDSIIQVFKGGTTPFAISTSADNLGQWSVDGTGTPLPAGNDSLTATATDDAGNVSSASPAFAVVIDTTAPAVLSITRGSSTPTNAASVAFNVTMSETVSDLDTDDFALNGTAELVAYAILLAEQ